jgi:hypothetical protein
MNNVVHKYLIYLSIYFCLTLHYITLVIIQFHSKTDGPYNITKSLTFFLAFPLHRLATHSSQIDHLSQSPPFITRSTSDHLFLTAASAKHLCNL